MPASPLAGKPAPASILVDVPRLITAYYALHPDPGDATQQVSFGTSGHRGTPLDGTFNEDHIAAITQAICEYRREAGVAGPLYMGMDSHAVSLPAWTTALEVLAANHVDTMIAEDEYTPTPAVSHAILAHNRESTGGQADGIVITPSHNPPEDGGFKYNPPTGGPADTDVTSAIQDRANQILADGLRDVRRLPLERARRAATTHDFDFLGQYVGALATVLDLQAIRASGLRLGVDPLGGASVRFWEAIADRWDIDLDVVNRETDPTFRFMTVDWDGKIRMDPSSRDAMAGLITLRDRYDIAFACDTDSDRHGIVTRGAGLLQPNHYLAVCVDYLYRHRSGWPDTAAVGKTVVSSTMIDRVTDALGRRLYEVPVGFKWFVDGLLDASLGFGGEESAGASFLSLDGRAWSTDKDGIIAALLSAEILAVTGKDPGLQYRQLTEQFGDPVYERIDAPADAREKAALKNLSPERIRANDLAGEPIVAVLTRAPGNDAPIGGLKVVSDAGWFAARPSGTEDIYKIYAESFRGAEHLRAIQQEAQHIVRAALGAVAG